MSGETKAGVEAVTNTALDYQLLSPHTAFVAISADVRVNPQEQSVSVQVPVEMPEGVSHASVVGGAAAGALPVTAMTAMPAAEVFASLKTLCAQSLSQRSRATIAPQKSMKGVMSPMSGRRIPDHCNPTPRPFGADSPGALPESGAKAGVGRESLQVVRVAGLAQWEIDLLTQRLQSLVLPIRFGGELVSEFQVAKGRIRQVVLDEQASTLKDDTVVEEIR